MCPFHPELDSQRSGCEAILFEVSSFLLEEPEDFRRVMLNKVCAFQLQPFLEILWQGMYQRRWPSFYDCLTHHQAKAWCALYGQTLRGQRDFPLEVFERELLGMRMPLLIHDPLPKHLASPPCKEENRIFDVRDASAGVLQPARRRSEVVMQLDLWAKRGLVG
eukprot:Skav208047  [mRNA]  locus=scaffold1124:54024:57670:- [translate_table: standard]